jgi:hypothetical protein
VIVETETRIEWRRPAPDSSLPHSGRLLGYAVPDRSTGSLKWRVVLRRTPNATNWAGSVRQLVADRTAARLRLDQLDGAR